MNFCPRWHLQLPRKVTQCTARLNVQSPVCRGPNTYLAVYTQSYMNTRSSSFSIACSPYRAMSIETLGICSQQPFPLSLHPFRLFSLLKYAGLAPSFHPHRCTLVTPSLPYLRRGSCLCYEIFLFCKTEHPQDNQPFLVLISGLLSLSCQAWEGFYTLQSPPCKFLNLSLWGRREEEHKACSPLLVR